MATMNQEKKASIAAELKRIMPKGWKYSLSVDHHSTLILTIQSAPVDLIAESLFEDKSGNYIDVNEYYLERAFEGELLDTFEAIKAAMNTGNHNRSDIQTDYFDVGHYVSIKIGRWNKPFVHMPAAA